MASTRRFIDNLHKNNFKFLGSGYYSVVLQHSTTDKVIKVGAALQDPWLTYVTMHAEDYVNIHKLKVGKITRIDPYYVAEMESLEPIPYSKEAQDFVSLLQQLVADEITYSYDHSVIISNFCKTTKVKVNTKELLELVDDLIFVKLNNDSFCVDLHGDNIMKRANGELVITDPFSDYSELPESGNSLRRTFTTNTYDD